MARLFIVLLGLMRKRVFGMNSPVIIIIMVDIIVCNVSCAEGVSFSVARMVWLRRLAIRIP